MAVSSSPTNADAIRDQKAWADRQAGGIAVRALAGHWRKCDRPKGRCEACGAEVRNAAEVSVQPAGPAVAGALNPARKIKKLRQSPNRCEPGRYSRPPSCAGNSRPCWKCCPRVRPHIQSSKKSLDLQAEECAIGVVGRRECFRNGGRRSVPPLTCFEFQGFECPASGRAVCRAR
jgi:hypothetical protein